MGNAALFPGSGLSLTEKPYEALLPFLLWVDVNHPPPTPFSQRLYEETLPLTGHRVTTPPRRSLCSNAKPELSSFGSRPAAPRLQRLNAPVSLTTDPTADDRSSTSVTSTQCDAAPVSRMGSSPRPPAARSRAVTQLVRPVGCRGVDTGDPCVSRKENQFPAANHFRSAAEKPMPAQEKDEEAGKTGPEKEKREETHVEDEAHQVSGKNGDTKANEKTDAGAVVGDGKAVVEIVRNNKRTSALSGTDNLKPGRPKSHSTSPPRVGARLQQQEEEELNLTRDLLFSQQPPNRASGSGDDDVVGSVNKCPSVSSTAETRATDLVDSKTAMADGREPWLPLRPVNAACRPEAQSGSEVARMQRDESCARSAAATEFMDSAALPIPEIHKLGSRRNSERVTLLSNKDYARERKKYRHMLTQMLLERQQQSLETQQSPEDVDSSQDARRHVVVQSEAHLGTQGNTQRSSSVQSGRRGDFGEADFVGEENENDDGDEEEEQEERGRLPVRRPSIRIKFRQQLRAKDICGFTVRMPLLACEADDMSYVNILYCHSQTVDLRDVVNELQVISKRLHANIYAIEYPGYGICTWTSSSEKNLNKWLRAAFYFLVSLNVPQESIVLWGCGVGSGPVCALAMELQRQGGYVAGLILQSPFASVRTLAQDSLGWLGAYTALEANWRNDQVLKHLNDDLPILIIHPQTDSQIGWHHAKALAESAPRATAVYPKGWGHDIVNVNELIIIVSRYLKTLSIPLPAVTIVASQHRRVPIYLDANKILSAVLPSSSSSSGSLSFSHAASSLRPRQIRGRIPSVASNVFFPPHSQYQQRRRLSQRQLQYAPQEEYYDTGVRTASRLRRPSTGGRSKVSAKPSNSATGTPPSHCASASLLSGCLSCSSAAAPRERCISPHPSVPRRRSRFLRCSSTSSSVLSPASESSMGSAATNTKAKSCLAPSARRKHLDASTQAPQASPKPGRYSVIGSSATFSAIINTLTAASERTGEEISSVACPAVTQSPTALDASRMPSLSNRHTATVPNTQGIMFTSYHYKPDPGSDP